MKRTEKIASTLFLSIAFLSLTLVLIFVQDVTKLLSKDLFFTLGIIFLDFFIVSLVSLCYQLIKFTKEYEFKFEIKEKKDK